MAYHKYDTASIDDIWHHIDDRDLLRGVCEYHPGGSIWCGQGVISGSLSGEEKYAGFRRGARYIVIDRLNEGRTYASHDSFWVCHQHRPDWLETAIGNSYEVWEVQPGGRQAVCIVECRKDLDRMFKVTFMLRTPNDVDRNELSNHVKAVLSSEVRDTDRIDGWRDLNINDMGQTTKSMEEGAWFS